MAFQSAKILKISLGGMPTDPLHCRYMVLLPSAALHLTTPIEISVYGPGRDNSW